MAFSSSAVASPSGYRGGRYAYYKWELDPQGNRVKPERCYLEHKPDLQSTYLYNQDGSEALRNLFFDIDASRTRPQWKDEFGVVSWPLIETFLAQEYPEILRYIEFGMRSHGGKGLHILLGFAALPLREQTFQTQMLCRWIQSSLIKIFNEIGIGADEGAKGLKRTFSTFQNEKNVVYRNGFLTNRIEKSANKTAGAVQEPFLFYIKTACNSALEKLGIKYGHRLYHDLRLEPKLARLFLFCLGMYEPNVQKDESKIESHLLYTNPNFSSVNVTLDELAHIMKTKKKFIYKSFWEKEKIKRLFVTEKNEDGSMTITVNLVEIEEKMDKLIERARAIHNYEPTDFKMNLVRPENVVDGLRNTAITSWAINLKWHGVAQEEAHNRLLELVKGIPDYESSSSCKASHVKATISSVYRNHREKFGIKLYCDLPEWLKANIPRYKATFVIYPLSSSRTLPVPRLLGSISRVWGGDLPDVDLSSFLEGLSEGRKIGSKTPINLNPSGLEEVQTIQEQTQGFVQNNENQDKKEFLFKSSSHNKLRTVTYNQRIGFYLNGELLLCLVQNRHYKLSPAVEYIEKKILHNQIKFDIFKDVIHMRRNTKNYKRLALQLYDESVICLQAQHVCGYKKSYSESMDEYHLKKAREQCLDLDEYRCRVLKRNEGLKIVGQDEMFDEIPF